jgi:hypothetical protein
MHRHVLPVAAVLSLSLLAACGQKAAKEPAFNALNRAQFNDAAAKRFLPLFWREDTNNDNTLQPGELAVLWGLPDDDATLWIAQGKFTPRFIETYATLAAAPATPATPPDARQQALLEELAQAVPTLVHTDLAADTLEERAMVRHLQAAAKGIERLYARQNGVFGMAEKIPADDLASRAVFHRNQSPFCEAPKTENNADCVALLPRPERIVGLYPAAIQKEPGFCQRLEKEPNAKALLDHFSTVEEDPAKPGRFIAVPYPEAWAEDMQFVATKLKAAADSLGTREQALGAYLRAAAEAFATNDWEPANRAWKAMNATNSKWFLRVGPDETYYDPCAWKAGFAMELARINPDSIQWQQKLEPLKNEMEQQLATLAGKPYKARQVNFALPDFIDVVLNAGDQRSAFGATIGQSLPNWGPVAAAGGRTVTMTNLYTDADSRARKSQQESSMLCKATFEAWPSTNTETVFNSLLHEAAHNLGPSHEYAVAGKTDRDAFGGTLASTFEELKAQNSALYLTSFLVTKGVFTDEQRKKILRDDVTWAFGHISRGMYEADGKPRNYSQLAAIQVGSFMEDGALTWHADETAANGTDKGCISVDYDKLPAAVEKLEAAVLGIKGRADRRGAEALKAKHVDAKDGFADIKATIAERYLRTPRVNFVYSITSN